MHHVSDVDECAAGRDGCMHICVNTEGSYTCSCNTGYLLDSDMRSCSGWYITSFTCFNSLYYFIYALYIV